MVLMPGLKGKYDAWNRLVEVRDSSDNLLGRYEYNGKDQRIKKTVGNITKKSFFNEEWQELESVTENDSLTTFIWGLRYTDDLILREKGSERLYSLADPNWNVVAVADASGVVQERMRYDAFGTVTWMDGDFAIRNESACEWNRVFTGQVFDVETGLVLYRKRYYHTELGRFVLRDPIVYEAKDCNLFRYVLNSPYAYVDPYGTQTKPIGASKKPKPKPCGAVSLFNDEAGMPTWKTVAEKTGTAVPMKGKGANAITDFTTSNSCCIPTLSIIDHGMLGKQLIGAKENPITGEKIPLPITPGDAKSLCDSLCDNAIVRFFGCRVASGDEESIRLMFQNCPKVDTITACPGLVDNTNIPIEKSDWNYGCNSSTVVGGKNLPDWKTYGPNDFPLVPTTKP